MAMQIEHLDSNQHHTKHEEESLQFELEASSRRHNPFYNSDKFGPLLAYRFGPFSEFIMAVSLSDNFKLPITLCPYDGMSDPQTQVTMFKSIMLLNGVVDLYLGRAFPTFLEKLAVLCFSSLTVGSIHNFFEISQTFVNQFSSSQIYTKTIDALNHVK